MFSLREFLSRRHITGTVIRTMTCLSVLFLTFSALLSLSNSRSAELGPRAIAFLVVLTFAMFALCLFFAYRRPQMSDIDKSVFALIMFFFSAFVFCARVINYTEGISSPNELIQAIGEFLAMCTASIGLFCEYYMQWLKRNKASTVQKERRQEERERQEEAARESEKAAKKADGKKKRDAKKKAEAEAKTKAKDNSNEHDEETIGLMA